MGPRKLQCLAAWVPRQVLLSWLLKRAYRRILLLCRHLYRLSLWVKLLWTGSKRPPPGSVNSPTDNTPATTIPPYTIVGNGSTIPLDWVATSLDHVSNKPAANAPSLQVRFVPDTPYTIVEDGETISMSGIATSLYPFSNGNIRNTSRSSVRSSHNPSVQSQNAPESPGRPGSLMSCRSAASSFYDLPISDPNPDATDRRPMPLPQLQRSASMPHLHAHTDLDREGSIDIKVTSPISPGNYSTTSLHIPPNLDNLQPPRPRPLPDGLNIETADRPRNYAQTTFEVPPSPESTNAHPVVDPEARYVRPAFPTETQRYRRQTKIPKVQTNMTFPPITLDYSRPVPPDGWERFAHPEGYRYFHNKELRVYTDAEIYEPVVLAHLEADIAHLKAVSTTLQNPFPTTGEFVINVYWDRTTDVNSSEDLISEYYCVDHATRLIFFLKDFQSDWMDAWHEARGGISSFHLQYELQAQYWYFSQLYPSAIDLKADMIHELREIVVYLISDTSTSPFSTACFSPEILRDILSVVSELAENVGRKSYGSVCLIGRYLYVFNHSRFLNFHGEPYARVERNFSVYDDQSLQRRTWWMKILSWILFLAPVEHFTSFRALSVDGMIHKATLWVKMEQLNKEWKDVIVLATVLLNANIAFLAIQSVDIDVNPYRSPTQISSYISVAANLGSIILGLLLTRWGEESQSNQVSEFLQMRNAQTTLSLQPFAIVYSVPYALLMWGVIAFVAAFSIMVFQNSNISTRSIVGTAYFLSCVPIVSWVCISWENKKNTTPSPRPLAYFHPNDSRLEILEGESDVGTKKQSLTKSLLASTRLRITRLCGLFGTRAQINDIELAPNTPAEA